MAQISPGGFADGTGIEAQAGSPEAPEAVVQVDSQTKVLPKAENTTSSVSPFYRHLGHKMTCKVQKKDKTTPPCFEAALSGTSQFRAKGKESRVQDHG